MANGGKLYVFLHGLSVAAERGNDLVIVLPKVPGHVQKIGSWLGETAVMRESPLRLRGVRSGNATFSQKEFIVRLPNTSLTAKKRAATLRIPRPKEILGLLLATDDEYVVRARGRGAVPLFKNLSTVQVLVYEYDDETRVSLEGHYWEPYPTAGAMSLHVISTSEQREGQQHEDQTEEVLSNVVSGYPGLDYRNPRALAAQWIDPRNAEFGLLKTDLINLTVEGEYIVEEGGKFAFAQAELEHPTARIDRLTRLGRLKRSKLPIASLWQDPDALGDRVSNCITISTD